eukprot:CAMPEP_0171132718 /NCGR_PEP_ID=MMETSP0766_2-20121228/125044_1 /TAXON_ID=439317 /ORGANISM="Gambierdiscus australes, Strain CAWD 149" /LENGTH=416 /DNA_ID=CAMNT_0011596067 /DNA_START=20 /DNA_END=1270 /DNA_ORIENTATION=+
MRPLALAPLASLLATPREVGALRLAPRSMDPSGCGEGVMTFHEFKGKYGRTYVEGTEEHTQREALFTRRAAAVASHNCKEGLSWKAGINHLSDWTDTEFSGLLGFQGGASPRATARATDSGVLTFWSEDVQRSLPESFDWGRLASISSVRDQGACGSCWAFAAETVLRAHTEIRFGEHQNYSVGQIIACTPNPRKCGGDGGCSGATVELAYDYALHQDLLPESMFPYQAAGGKHSCPQGLQLASLSARRARGVVTADGREVHMRVAGKEGIGRGVRMIGWTKFPENRQAEMVRALVNDGPLAIAVAAGQKWVSYMAGVLSARECEKFLISHAVVLFGYGISSFKSQKFWHIKNSWGQDWGERGNVRLQRFDDEEVVCGWDKQPQIGTGCKGGPREVWVCGSCGILYDTSMPILQKP